jgi:hypothetical protein
MKANALREDIEKECIFVIPDTNGEFGMVTTLLDMITSGKHYPLAKNDTVIFLGQYMGRKTKSVIEKIREFQEKMECDVVCLTGPDDFRFMKGREQFYSSELGQQVVNSYREDYPNNPKHFNQNAVDVSQIMKDRNWLASLHSFYITDKMLFCYGGIDPNKALNNQNVGALMFNSCNEKISKAFQTHMDEFERIVVHSGFPTKAKPFIKKADTGKLNRINVNTDSPNTGYLACSVLDAKTGELITTISVYHPDRYPSWCKKNGIAFKEKK